MSTKQIIKKKKGYLVKHKGTRGQTYYGGSASPSGASFFEFNVTDNLKRAGKNLKKFAKDLID